MERQRQGSGVPMPLHSGRLRRRSWFRHSLGRSGFRALWIAAASLLVVSMIDRDGLDRGPRRRSALSARIGQPSQGPGGKISQELREILLRLKVVALAAARPYMEVYIS